MQLNPRFVLVLVVFLSALFYVVPTSSAQSLSDRVLVIYNANDTESRAVADYYMLKRNIPAANLLDINPSNTDDISYSQFTTQVRDRIRAKLNTRDQSGTLYKNKILYIVFSYKTPYRVSGAPITIPNVYPGDEGRGTSIDQYVARIFDDSTSGSNPYYAESYSKANQYQPFVSLAQHRPSQGSLPTYSVWRLDAPSADIAKGLVDKAMTAETNGLQGKGLLR